MTVVPRTALPTLPPGPRARFPAQQVIAFRRNPLAYLEQLATFGDITSFPGLGGRSVYVISHPDLVKEVLVTRAEDFRKGRALRHANSLLGNGLLTSEGTEHRRQRRIMQPSLHPSRLAMYGDAIVRLAQRVGERWSDGTAIDVHDEMMHLTLAIVAGTLLGTEVQSDVRRIGQDVEMAIGMFDRSLLPWGNLLDKLPLPSNYRFRAARARLFGTIDQIIAERHARRHASADLLSVLLDARDEGEEGQSGDGTGLSDELVRDQAITIFLAGHETTANALTFAWYCLSQHPQVAEQMRAELAAVLGDRPPTAEDLPKLAYTRAVLAETMRLYPPAWTLGREAKVELNLASYTIPAECLVLSSQWLMHRDARWWPDPLRFDPQRWLGERAPSRPKYAYFPFGGGARACIGEAFAWMEAMLVLATLGRRWRLELEPGYRLKLHATITLRPRGGMGMVVKGNLEQEKAGAALRPAPA